MVASASSTRVPTLTRTARAATAVECTCISPPQVKTPGTKVNPFKKKTMASPAKSNGSGGLLGAFAREATPVLKRSSTFSKEARTKAKHDKLR